jgi:hypothetical protein
VVHRFTPVKSGKNKICEHGKRRTRCRDCGGGSICPHERVKVSCAWCKREKLAAQNQFGATP